MRERGWLARHVLLAMAARGISAVGSVAFTYVVARELDTGAAAIVLVGHTLVVVAASVTRLGMDRSLLRHAGEAWGSHTVGSTWRLVNTAAVPAVLAGTIVAVLITWLGPRVAPGPLGDATRLFGLAIAPMSLLGVIGAALQAIDRPASSALLVNGFVPLAVATVLLAVGGTAVSTGRSYVLAAAAAVVVSYAWFASRVPGEIKRPDVRSVSLLWSTASPLWIAVIMVESATWSSQLLASTLLDARDVAALAISQRIAMGATIVLMATSAVVSPRFASLSATADHVGLRRLARRSVAVTGAVGGPLCVVLFVWSPWVLGLFGDEYTSFSWVLRAFLAGQLLNVLAGPAGMLLAMTDHERDLRNVLVVTGVAAPALALAGIAVGGVHGAAGAAAGITAVQNVLLVRLVRARLGFNLWPWRAGSVVSRG